MFNKEFFPTPPEVAERMLEPYRELIKSGATILDPSAGTGNLLRKAKHYGANDRQLFAIEIEPDLSAILRENKFRLIGDDFLRYESQYVFDLIVMNPPWSNGDEHLLQAWNILRHGEIVCLLNAATLENDYSARRKLLLEIISRHGSSENLGPVFKSADRKTSADAVLVRLSKKAENPLFEFQPREAPGKTYEGGEPFDLDSQVAKSDLIEALVTSYRQIGPAYERFIAAREELEFYARTVTTRYFKFDVEDARRTARYYGSDQRQKAKLENTAEYNAYLDAIKFSAWQRVFETTKIQEVLTADMREKFNAFQQQAGTVEFSETNIWAFFEMLINNRGENMRRCIVEVFDKMCSYDAKNVLHVEGWKTNSRYKVNRKVIMPYFINFNTYYQSGSVPGKFETNYRNEERLRDIDRVLCMLSGKSLSDIVTIERALKDKFQELGQIRPGQVFENVVESEFFRIKFWKKGTMHLEFLDDYLWQEFNRQAAKGKNWVGDGE